MAGFQAVLPELTSLGAKVVAASVDPLEKAREVAAGLSYPHGYGVTREIGNLLGSWWEERRNFIQPSEFLLDDSGKVLISSYSAGPLGRIEGPDVVKLIKLYESRKAAQAKGPGANS